MMTVLTMICIFCILVFLLPVLTARDLNAGNSYGLLVSGLSLYAVRHPEQIASLPNLLKLFLFLFCTALALEAVLCFYLMYRTCVSSPEKVYNVIVLGCRVYGEIPSLTLEKRILAAYDYLVEHPSAKCIVSGGKGSDEGISEAEAMYRYLVNKGISPERVLREDQSTTTYENFLFSKRILQEQQWEETLMVSTSEFHEYRASLIASKIGLKTYALPAKTPWWLFPTYCVRELLVIPKDYLKMKNNG